MANSIYVDQTMQSAGQTIKTQVWSALEKKYEFWGKDMICAVYQEGKLLGKKKIKNSFCELGKSFNAKSSGLFGLGKCKDIKAHFCNCQPWSAKIDLHGSNLLRSQGFMFKGYCECKITDVDFDAFYRWCDTVGLKSENGCDLSLYRFQDLVVNLFVKKVWETSIMNFDPKSKVWMVGLNPKDYPEFIETFIQRVKTNISNMGITCDFNMVYKLN